MLRPMDTTTGLVKKFEDYTTEEAEGALVQFNEVINRHVQNEKPLDPKFCREYVLLAKKTAKANNIPDIITDTLKAESSKQAKST